MRGILNFKKSEVFFVSERFALVLVPRLPALAATYTAGTKRN